MTTGHAITFVFYQNFGKLVLSLILSPGLLPENLVGLLQSLGVIFANFMVDVRSLHKLITAPIICLPIETVGFSFGAVEPFFDKLIVVPGQTHPHPRLWKLLPLRFIEVMSINTRQSEILKL